MNSELFELAEGRVKEICTGQTGEPAQEIKEPYCLYFQQVAFFLCRLLEVYRAIRKGESAAWKLSDWQEKNRLLYEDILQDAYETSYANPEYASRCLGGQYGTLLSAVYALLRGCIPDAYEGREERLLAHLQFFLELYTSFVCAADDGLQAPAYELLRENLYDFVFCQYEYEADEAVKAKIDPAADFAYRLVMESELADIGYLYQYGEYITANQIETAKHLQGLSPKQLQLMADTFTEGYRIGFEKTGKDLSVKKTVQIIYPIGFEPMIRLAIANFEKMGLQAVLKRDSRSVYDKRYGSESGYYGENPNRQYEYDHREDAALFADKKLLKRRLDCMTNAYMKRKDLARQMAGPAVIECFGMELFAPQNKASAAPLSATQRELMAWYDSSQGEMINRFIPEEERSFTIIAFPVPAIGEKYAEIMQETIRLNTLDWRVYERVQQEMINALDTCEKVQVKGANGNRTDLTVRLTELKDADKETKFENCVADVNIPVGEVFTSPVLTGTTGRLHVKKVFLNGLEYRDLYLQIEDGRVTDYGCGNFDNPAEGRKLIEAEILHHHKLLPVGEFAIGTNTLAYMMSRKYGIEDKMPILIAEKTGPHLAVGDTCYSHAEDIRVYNPDGKEIIARDNEVSLKRRDGDEKVRESAYYHCHTDITIPYDELGELAGVRTDGSRVSIIENGRFVLPAALLLNEALEHKA